MTTVLLCSDHFFAIAHTTDNLVKVKRWSENTTPGGGLLCSATVRASDNPPMLTIVWGTRPSLLCWPFRAQLTTLQRLPLFGKRTPLLAIAHNSQPSRACTCLETRPPLLCWPSRAQLATLQRLPLVGKPITSPPLLSWPLHKMIHNGTRYKDCN
jgi:hypothetical protein